MSTVERVWLVLQRKASPIGMTDLANAVQRPRSEVRKIVRALDARRVGRLQRMRIVRPVEEHLPW